MTAPSLAAELWNECSSYPVGDEGACTQEAAGLMAGFPFALRDGSAVFGVSRPWAARRLLRLWKASRWKDFPLAARVRVPPGMKGRVRLDMPRRLYGEVLAEGRDNWDWVRGFWESCGALYVPRSGYYLAMRAIREDAAERLARMLRQGRVSCAVRAARGRQPRREFIVRGQEDIATFLSRIGLTGATLLLEDKAVLRTVRNQANRMSNCDTANIRKSLKTAEEQMNLALSLQRRGLVAALPGRFRTLVEARLGNPEATLSELGKLLSPPVTKSTVKYRWERLRREAAPDL